MQDLHTGDRGLVAGAVVAARGRHWRVVDAEAHAACVEVRLAPINHAGAAATLLHPFDRITPVPVSDRPRRTSRRRAAEAAAAALVDSHPWTGLRAALPADIRLLPYQLDPALAIVSGQTTRILLADDVGLGKTIQAGLILAELRARHELTRALIVTPAGLRDQWEQELRQRFDLVTRHVDAAFLAEAGQLLPPWIDPWGLPGIAVVSIDLLKRREVNAQLRQAVWDVVIVDEAHHARPGTERGEAAVMVCGRARHVVLITATPHDGSPTAFDALLDLGRLTQSEPGMRVFRRTRLAVSPGMAARRTRNVYVRPGPAERRMFAVLDRYTARVWQECHRQDGAGDPRLAMIVLRKRALSSAASLVRSVSRRIVALADREPPDVRTQLALRFEDALDGELIAGDAEPGWVLGAPGLPNVADEQSLLQDVLEAARQAAREESKQRLLASALRRVREPVIVFTEYRDTLEELARALGPIGVAQLHGGLMPADRRATIEAFTGGRARVLLATDAAAEGLNLHHRCRWVVHYELPWNPVRLEQRTGRVDRLGQARRVHAWRLVAAGTDETRILQHLERREAFSEEQIARAVFETAPAAGLRLSMEGRRQNITRAARQEAERLRQLRRLHRFRPRPSIRPTIARARQRGGFRSMGREAQLTLRCLRALDARGRRVAEICQGTITPAASPRLAVEARALGERSWNGERRSVDRRSSGATLRREIAYHRAWLRLAITRDEALAAVGSETNRRALQMSLFNREALREAERQRVRATRAVDELDQHRRRLLASLAHPRVDSAAVAIFHVW